MNSRRQLPAGLKRRHWRRAGRAIGVSSGKPERYLHARRRGLRRFAGGLITLGVVLCVLAVFA